MKEKDRYLSQTSATTYLGELGNGKVPRRVKYLVRRESIWNDLHRFEKKNFLFFIIGYRRWWLESKSYTYTKTEGGARVTYLIRIYKNDNILSQRRRERRREWDIKSSTYNTIYPYKWEELTPDWLNKDYLSYFVYIVWHWRVWSDIFSRYRRQNHWQKENPVNTVVCVEGSKLLCPTRLLSRHLVP